MLHLELETVRLHYQVRGDDGPWIVLLHGGLVDMTSFDGLAEQLSAFARVVLTDLRGYGESTSTNGDLSLTASARDVVDLLDHLGVSQAVVFGFSVGGMIAQLVALTEPDRVAGLVLVSTGCRVSREQARAFLDRADRIDEHGLEGEGAEHVTRAFSPTWVEQHPAQFRSYADRVAINDPAVVASTLRSIARFDVAQELAAITSPVVLLAGELDVGFGPDAARETAGFLPSADVHEIPAAGHTVHLERPESVVTHVRDLLASGPRAAHASTEIHNVV